MLAVALHESRMKEIFSRVSDIIRVNLPGPGLYIEFYNDYFWLLDGTADEQLQAFLDREPNFKVCTKIFVCELINACEPRLN